MDEDFIPEGTVLDTPEKLRLRAVLHVDKRAMNALKETRIYFTIGGEEVECRAYPRLARRERGVWLVPCDAGLFGFFSGYALPDETPAATVLRVLAALEAGTLGPVGTMGRTVH